MRLNRRGEIVLGILLIVGAIEIVLGAYYIVSHINWVGDHYCWGSLTECYFGDK